MEERQLQMETKMERIQLHFVLVHMETKSRQFEMQRRPLFRMLLNNIRLGHDANELVRMFNDAYATLSGINNTLTIQMLLNAATEHNHRDLVKILLSNLRIRDISAFVSITPPLLIAISRGNLTLVEDFLYSGLLVNLVIGYRTELSSDAVITTSTADVSAIEYACLFDQRDSLKLLVSRDSRVRYLWYSLFIIFTQLYSAEHLHHLTALFVEESGARLAP